MAEAPQQDAHAELDTTRRRIAEIQALGERARASRTPHSKAFAAFCADLASAINNGVNEVEATLPSYPSVSQQVKQLTYVQQCVANFFYSLNDYWESHLRVVSKAREIYYLCDWFMGEVEGSSSYLVVEGYDVATLSFLDIAYSRYGGKGGLPDRIPELWEKLTDLQFDFVIIPAQLATTSSSFEWAVVLHELAHIAVRDRNVLPELNGITLPKFIYDLRTLASRSEKDGQIDEESIETAKGLLHALEYLADSIACSVLGPGFSWCLIVFFANRADAIFPDQAHPDMASRIGLQAWLLEQQGLLQDAKNTRDQFANQLKALFEEKTPEDISADVAGAVDRLRTNFPGFEELLTAISRAVPAPFGLAHANAVLAELGPTRGRVTSIRDRLREEFLQGKPVITSPALQYYIMLPLERATGGLGFSDFFADCFKLHHVKSSVEQALQGGP